MDRAALVVMKTQEATLNSPVVTAAALSVLLLAALLAVVFHSVAVFLFVLCAVFVPLVGTFYPPIVLM